jgi:hypothetical protein
MSDIKTRSRVLWGISILILIGVAFLIYSMNITEFSFRAIEKEGGGEAVTETETPEIETSETGSGIQFTGNLIFTERINREENIYIFNRTLEERTRLVIEGDFEQPVRFVLLTEPYYSNWLRERIVKTHNGYVKDPTEGFSIRVDINENAGGVYYFIIQSLENKINGEVKIFGVAKL